MMRQRFQCDVSVVEWLEHFLKKILRAIHCEPVGNVKGPNDGLHDVRECLMLRISLLPPTIFA